MREEIEKLVNKTMLSKNRKAELIESLLVLFNVSVSESSDFELQRLFDWLQDNKREPAQTKFTAGMTRNVAREFEFLLKNA